MVDYFVLIVVYFKFVFFLCVENWENEILRYYEDLSCRGILNLVMSISINFFFGNLIECDFLYDFGVCCEICLGVIFIYFILKYEIW